MLAPRIVPIAALQAPFAKPCKAMAGVENHCFIANSITARVTLTPEFVVASQ